MKNLIIYFSLNRWFCLFLQCSNRRDVLPRQTIQRHGQNSNRVQSGILQGDQLNMAVFSCIKRLVQCTPTVHRLTVIIPKVPEKHGHV